MVGRAAETATPIREQATVGELKKTKILAGLQTPVILRFLLPSVASPRQSLHGTRRYVVAVHNHQFSDLVSRVPEGGGFEERSPHIF
jgi:hypothetical protein